MDGRLFVLLVGGALITLVSVLRLVLHGIGWVPGVGVAVGVALLAQAFVLWRKSAHGS
jgi:hypothetical protein